MANESDHASVHEEEQYLDLIRKIVQTGGYKET